MCMQHTKHLLFPRPLYGSKLFRNLLFQVLLYLAIICIGMTFAIVGLYSGRPWPKLGGKLEKKYDLTDVDRISCHTTTYALKQIIQFTNSLLFLPLHAANPDSRSVNGPFPPDRSTILCSLSDENVCSIAYSQYPSQNDIAFWVSNRLPGDVWRLTLSIQRNSERTVLYCTLTGIDGDRLCCFLSAAGPRAGNSVLASILQSNTAEFRLTSICPLEICFSLPRGNATP